MRDLKDVAGEMSDWTATANKFKLIKLSFNVKEELTYLIKC